MYAIDAYGVQCLAAGCRESGAGQQGVRPGRTTCSPEPDPRQPAAKHCTP